MWFFLFPRLRSLVAVLLCYVFLLTSNPALQAQTTVQQASRSATSLFGTLTTFPKTPGQLEQYAFERVLAKSLGEALPIKLDASTTYPTVANNALPGGAFNGKPLAPTAENLTKPLPAGDWIVPALAFCQEYSVHQPGAGTAYKIGPLQGKQAELIGTFLWRGVIAGKSPSELQTVEWAIEAGVTYDKMPKPYQADIDQLIPNYKSQLQENWLERPQAAYKQAIGNPSQAVQSLGKIPGVGLMMGMMLKALPTPPPTLQGFLTKAGMGEAGRFYTEAEGLQPKYLTPYTNEQLREQTLFQGQGSQLPPVPAQEGPWTIKATGVYMRFKVQGGNLQANNSLEIRVLPQTTTARLNRKPHLVYASYEPQAAPTSTTAQQTTLLGIMGLTLAGPKLAGAAGTAGEILEGAELIGVIASGAEIAFAVGVGAQALIIVLPMVLHSLKNPATSQTNTQAQTKTKTDEQKNRGRIQAQGGGLEASVPWNTSSPPTVNDGLTMLNQLKQQLTPAQLLAREQAFSEAETYIIRVGQAGGVQATVSKSFPGVKPKGKGSDIRVDVEVRAGTAFVPSSPVPSPGP